MLDRASAQRREQKKERLNRGIAAFDIEDQQQQDKAQLEDEFLGLNRLDAEGRDVDRLYDTLATNSRQKENLGYTLMLLASLEDNLHQEQSQGKILDDLVDLAVAAKGGRGE